MLKVNILDETSIRAKGRNYRRKVHVCRRDVGQDRWAKPSGVLTGMEVHLN